LIYLLKINRTGSLWRKSNKVSGFISQNACFPCFARGALAKSQQLPDNSEVKIGMRGITDLVLF
jgi:hypothetical protein